jgi:hypothetical protein
LTEKKKINSSEDQNTGIDTPTRANTMAALSTHVLCRTADTTPSPTPTTIEMARAARVS